MSLATGSNRQVALTELKVEGEALQPAVLHRLGEGVHLNLRSRGQGRGRLRAAPAAEGPPTAAHRSASKLPTDLALACQRTSRSSGRGRSSSIQPSPTAATLQLRLAGFVLSWMAEPHKQQGRRLPGIHGWCKRQAGLSMAMAGTGP